MEQYSPLLRALLCLTGPVAGKEDDGTRGDEFSDWRGAGTTTGEPLTASVGRRDQREASLTGAAGAGSAQQVGRGAGERSGWEASVTGRPVLGQRSGPAVAPVNGAAGRSSGRRRGAGECRSGPASCARGTGDWTEGHPDR